MALPMFFEYTFYICNHKMKKQCIFWVCVFYAVHIFPQTKHALILAVGDYPNAVENPWKDLSSANDARLIQGMLQKQGFMPENILVMRDADVKTDAVNSAFEQCLSRMREGDIFYFHFSGHGQQVQDVNGDEADGWDEALVLYDAPMLYSDGYKYDKHYTDDLLKTKLDAIRNKLGANGQVIMVIDACHSGTTTRSGNQMLIRGNSTPCTPPDYKASSAIKKGAFGVDADFTAKSMAGLFAFSGCRANEVNREYREEKNKLTTQYGSLSYFLAQAMQTLKGEASFINLFSIINQSIVVEFQDKQHPELEADNPRQLIFGAPGQFIEQKDFFSIKGNISFWAASPPTLNIEAGIINGISVGDTLGLYDVTAASPSQAKLLAKACIVNVTGPLESEAIITEKNADLEPEGVRYRLFRLNGSMPVAPLKLKLEMGKKQKKEFLKRIEKINNISITDTGFHYLLKEETTGKDKGKYTIYMGNDLKQRYKSMPSLPLAKPSDYQFFVDELANAMKIDFFRKLSTEDPNVSFSVSFTLFDTLNRKTIGESKNNLISAQFGSVYLVEIKNTCKQDINVYILNISQNQKIKAITLDEKGLLQPIKLRGYGGIAKPGLKFVDSGFDQYLVIASIKPLKLEPILEMGKEIQYRGDSNPFTEFLKAGAAGARSRGANRQGVTVKTLGVNVIIDK
jgi:hypothetical protein